MKQTPERETSGSVPGQGPKRGIRGALGRLTAGRHGSNASSDNQAWRARADEVIARHNDALALDIEAGVLDEERNAKPRRPRTPADLAAQAALEANLITNKNIQLTAEGLLAAIDRAREEAGQPPHDTRGHNPGS